MAAAVATCVDVGVDVGVLLVLTCFAIVFFVCLMFVLSLIHI